MINGSPYCLTDFSVKDESAISVAMIAFHSHHAKSSSLKKGGAFCMSCTDVTAGLRRLFRPANGGAGFSDAPWGSRRRG